jgi:alpha-maltose-1-phosphate synthase
VPLSTLPQSARRTFAKVARTSQATTLVACPDARPPAYQAVVGLVRAGTLRRFVTAGYYRGESLACSVAKRMMPGRFDRWERVLRRRHEPEIPAALVEPHWGYDGALAIENRLARLVPRGRRAVARHRTHAFDCAVARALDRHRPEAAFLFSDVGSEVALPLARRLGIASVLSMVTGDVREEQSVLEQEAEHAPDFFPIYLADGPIDRAELAWLHERRLRDIELADRIMVPSDHIADTLVAHGTARSRIAVVPYAADTRRFVPDPHKSHGPSCTFLFAGGITQRKGIKYLLEAWRLIRRPGWRLQLLGALPGDARPLAGYLDDVELLGRVGHAEMPARLAAADVFVFPSMFEGSAVVTYEALACGLPSIVTPSAGSVVRDGVDGFVVPPRDVEALADRMERLGNDPERRATFAASARARAEMYDWPRYHSAVVVAVADALAC